MRDVLLRTSSFLTTALTRSHVLFRIVFSGWLLSMISVVPVVGQRVEIRPRIETERLQRGMRDLDRLSSHDLEEARRRFWQIDQPTEKRLRQKWATLGAPELESHKGTFAYTTPSKSALITGLDRGLDHDERQQPVYVRWVQESLNRTIGYDLRVDGALTPQTSEAVREFQRRNGLVTDGVVGPKTETKLIEVTKTRPPGSWLEASPRLNYFRGSRPVEYFLKRIEAAQAQHPPSESQRRLVFLDVKKRWGRISVAAHTGADFWFQEAGLSELSHPTTRYVSSIPELDNLIGDATTIIHRGDDLPTEWLDHLQGNRDYLRGSSHSPKHAVGEYTEAARLLEHRAEVGKTRILSALPQARERNDLLRELANMDLPTEEVGKWEQLQKDLDEFQGQSKFPVEAATKEAFLEELSKGENDYVVLIAHFADGKLHFPGGETMTTDELAAVQRKEAPQRAVILVSCSAGTVNSPVTSPAEIVLGGNMAQAVVAHPDPISALQVPDLLREFLIEGKKIREVFMGHGYRFIAEYLWPEREEGKKGIAAGLRKGALPPGQVARFGAG
jgi:putative peptidoglycan binding protein